jgi:hypothetical protein
MEALCDMELANQQILTAKTIEIDSILNLSSHLSKSNILALSNTNSRVAIQPKLKAVLCLPVPHLKLTEHNKMEAK